MLVVAGAGVIVRGRTMADDGGGQRWQAFRSLGIEAAFVNVGAMRVCVRMFV